MGVLYQGLEEGIIDPGACYVHKQAEIIAIISLADFQIAKCLLQP